MEDYEGRFDFHGLGQAIRKAREERGWTQKYVSELLGRGARTIMNIENKGQYPSFGVFVKLVTMFDIPVDQFIHADSGQGESSYRKELVGKLRSHNLHIGGGAPCSPIRKRRLIRKSKLDGAIKSFVESPVAGIWLHVKEKGSVPPGWSWP